MELAKLLVLIIVSYLLGSLPFGYFFVRIFKQKDVRSNGTGNIGATNTMLVGGKILGILTLVLDIAKGSAAIILARLYSGTDLAIILCGLAVVIGHDFSVFLKFKGGKGVSTTAGTMFIIDPVLTVICIFSYVLVLIVTRYVIISTLIILALLPAIMWMASYGLNFIVYGLLLFALALYAHRSDVARFLAGNEVRLGEALKKI